MVIMLVAYHEAVFGVVRSVWRGLYERVNRHALVAMLLAFIWICVARASAAFPSEARLLQRRMLPDIAKRVTGATPFVKANIDLAHALSEKLLRTVHIDFVLGEELVAILGEQHATDARVYYLTPAHGGTSCGASSA